MIPRGLRADGLTTVNHSLYVRLEEVRAHELPLSAERERESLNAGIEEFDLEPPVGDGLRLSD